MQALGLSCSVLFISHVVTQLVLLCSTMHTALCCWLHPCASIMQEGVKRKVELAASKLMCTASQVDLDFTDKIVALTLGCAEMSMIKGKKIKKIKIERWIVQY